MAYPIVAESISDKEDYLNILVYGEPGVGKTIFASSAVDVPEMSSVLFLDPERGMISIRRWRHNTDGIVRIPITTFKQVSQMYEWTKRHLQLRDQEVKGESDATKQLEALAARIPGLDPMARFNTIVLDSLTEIQKLIVYQITGMQIGAQSLDTQPNPVDFKGWYQNAEMVRGLIRSFRNLPINFITITGTVETTDPDGNSTLRPNLPGKLPGEILHFFDVIGYIAIGQKQVEGEMTSIRRMFLQPRTRFYAKNRLAGPDLAYIDNPTVGELIKANR